MLSCSSHPDHDNLTLTRHRPCRGKYSGDEAQRLQVLRQAAEEGAEYIDVELEAVDAFSLASQPLPRGVQLILSHHNFEATLAKSKLQALMGRMRDAGADIAKLAMTANDICDSRVMLDLLSEAQGATSHYSFAPRCVPARTAGVHCVSGTGRMGRDRRGECMQVRSLR